MDALDKVCETLEYGGFTKGLLLYGDRKIKHAQFKFVRTE